MSKIQRVKRRNWEGWNRIRQLVKGKARLTLDRDGKIVAIPLQRLQEGESWKTRNENN
jgi:hypothetical protein